MVVAADYTKHAKGGILTIYEISDGRRRNFREAIPVSGRREARLVAVAKSASPWNF